MLLQVNLKFQLAHLTIEGGQIVYPRDVARTEKQLAITRSYFG